MNYINIVTKYLEFLDVTFGKEANMKFTKHSMQELLRYSLCLNFGLQSNPSSTLARVYAKKCSKYIFGGKTHKHMETEKKQAVIEACMISLDKAFDKAKKGE